MPLKTLIKKIIIWIISINFFISLFFYYLYIVQKELIEKYEFTTSSLEKGIKQKIKISGNKVKILYREKEVVKEKVIYVPKEGSVTVIENNDSEIKVVPKNKGFTLKYGFGVLYDSKFYPSLDLKFLYFKQYSLVTSAYRNGLSLNVSRHVDDWLGDNFSNIEIQVGYNFLNPRFIIGVRSNF